DGRGAVAQGAGGGGGGRGGGRGRARAPPPPAASGPAAPPPARQLLRRKRRRISATISAITTIAMTRAITNSTMAMMPSFLKKPFVFFPTFFFHLELFFSL